jgi:hypothetical protein
MSQAEQTIANRRSVIKGAAITAGAVALAIVPVVAQAKVSDPIIALIAEAERLHGLAEETAGRVEAAAQALGADGSALWPIVDLDRAEFEPIRNWALLHHPDRRMPRHFIEGFNARTEEIVARIPEALAERQAQGAARLAHWDAAQAQRKERFESSGYRALSEEAEAIFDRRCELTVAICEAKAVTVEGAVAQISFASKKGRECRASSGDVHDYCEDVALTNAHETLARLLPAAA